MQPSTMKGIGGPGPRIQQDVLITARFRLKDTSYTHEFTVSAGVVPDGTFPGELTLGKSVFHKLGIQCGHDEKGENMVLNKMPKKPTLYPTLINGTPLRYTSNCVTETVYVQSEEPKVSWHKGTPVDDPTTKAYLREYIEQFPELFELAERRKDIKMKTKHYIDTGDHLPIKLPPRRYSPMQLKAMRDFIWKHILKIIQNGQGPWAAPALLTPKKAPGQTTKPDKNDIHVIWRFCCDYRELNKITKKNAYPLPNAADEIQRAAGHRYYCFIDLKNGFWHIEIYEPHREKTAFVTPFGLYEWMVMPFGLCNAPATFQALMEEILAPLRKFVSGMIDDIAIWGETSEQLHMRVKTLFQRLSDYGMIINAAKSTMFVRKGVFLGFVISEEGIEADPAKVSAVRERPKPETTTEVRAFVNAAGYFRHLIAGYSEMSAPLTGLTGGPKNHKITLNTEAETAWRQIRDVITTMPVVRKFNWQIPCIIETDASQRHVGAVLLQPHLHEGRNGTALHPVAYFSKKLTDTQTRYAAQERELLGIMLALQHWRHWVEGGNVTVITDHESLRTLSTKTEQPARIVRFLDAIEHYGIRIFYRPGKANVLADYLSRPTENTQDRAYPVEDQPDFVRNLDQLNRIDLQAIYEYLRYGTMLPPALQEEWVHENFVLHQEKLYKMVTNERHSGDPPHAAGTATRVRTPQEVVEYDDLMVNLRKIHHDQGHPTVGVLTRDALRQFWHPEITLAAQQVTLECPTCQLMKKPDPSLPDLQPIIPPTPLTRWAIDHTSISQSKILVAVEYATGWAEAQFVPSVQFTDTIPMIERIGTTFGYPKEWISDNAGAFNSHEAREWHQQHGSVVRPITPIRPRGNGKVEKANGDIKRIMLREHQANPTLNLPYLLQRAVTIYNRTPKPSGYSNYFLMFGTQPPQEQTQTELSEYVREPTEGEEVNFEKQLAEQHEAPTARNYHNGLKASRDRIRAYLQEKKGLIRTYATGDWVLRIRQRGGKHEPYYDGPWAIASCHSGNTYRIRSPGGIALPSKYNGTNLFPAYVDDGHPVRSLWYANKQLLEQDRQRLQSLLD